MDIGTAFLLGVLVGQWTLLIVIGRTVNRLLVLLADEEAKAGSSTGRNIIEYPSRDEYRDRW